MILQFEQSAYAIKNGIKSPSYAHPYEDSGLDVYSPIDVILKPKERKTVCLEVKFAIPNPSVFNILNKLFKLGLGIELQVRPKSGKSKDGIDIEIGTIDNGYRNFVGATITNTTSKNICIKTNEKLCQIVMVPVFNKVDLIAGKVDENTKRKLGGFGSTGK